jgi:hypothetical protein
MTVKRERNRESAWTKKKEKADEMTTQEGRGNGHGDMVSQWKAEADPFRKQVILGDSKATEQCHGSKRENEGLNESCQSFFIHHLYTKRLHTYQFHDFVDIHQCHHSGE